MTPNRLRVVPLSFSLSYVTRKKTARKNGRVKSWGPDARERVPPFACFSTPGFRAANFFAVFFRVSHNELKERVTSYNLHFSSYLMMFLNVKLIVGFVCAVFSVILCQFEDKDDLKET